MAKIYPKHLGNTRHRSLGSCVPMYNLLEAKTLDSKTISKYPTEQRPFSGIKGGVTLWGHPHRRKVQYNLGQSQVQCIKLKKKLQHKCFGYFFNSERLSSHPTKSLPQYEWGKLWFWVKKIFFGAKNREKLEKLISPLQIKCKMSFHIILIKLYNAFVIQHNLSSIQILLFRKQQLSRNNLMQNHRIL